MPNGWRDDGAMAARAAILEWMHAAEISDLDRTEPMMRKIFPLAALLALFVALSACSPAARFEMQGTYDVDLEVTESDHPDFAVGYTESSSATVAVDGEDVTFETPNLVLTGTRSGNDVQLTFSSEEQDVTFDLVWTSDETFTGTGRIEFSSGETVAVDVTGQESVSLAGGDAPAGEGLLR